MDLLKIYTNAYNACLISGDIMASSLHIKAKSAVDNALAFIKQQRKNAIEFIDDDNLAELICNVDKNLYESYVAAKLNSHNKERHANDLLSQITSDIEEFVLECWEIIPDNNWKVLKQQEPNWWHLIHPLVKKTTE